MWTFARSFLNAILGKTGKPDRCADTATPMAIDAGGGESRRNERGIRQPATDLDDPLEELVRIVGEQEPEAEARHPKVLTFPRRRRSR